MTTDLPLAAPNSGRNRPSDYRDEWEALKRKAVALQADTSTEDLPPSDPKVEAHEAAVAALNAEKDAVAHGAWLTTARDLDDLELLAEVAFDYFFDIATFPQYPADIDDRDDQQVAVAYLVRGVFAVRQSIADGGIHDGPY